MGAAEGSEAPAGTVQDGLNNLGFRIACVLVSAPHRRSDAKSEMTQSHTTEIGFWSDNNGPICHLRHPR